MYQCCSIVVVMVVVVAAVIVVEVTAPLSFLPHPKRTPTQP